MESKFCPEEETAEKERVCCKEIERACEKQNSVERLRERAFKRVKNERERERERKRESS